MNILTGASAGGSWKGKLGPRLGWSAGCGGWSAAPTSGRWLGWWDRKRSHKARRL